MHPKIVAARVGLSLLGALLAIESMPTSVSAQWLPDRNYTQGPGIRVGDLELHPGVAARAGYNSNIFYSEKGRETSGAMLAVTPHLHLSTLTQQRLNEGEDGAAKGTPVDRPVTFDLGVSSTFFHFFVDNTPTNAEVDTDGTVSIKPGGPVGLDIGAQYQRTLRPFTEFTGSATNTQYGRNHIAPTIRLRAQSRSGVLKGYLGYAPDINLYESSTFKYLNSVGHGITAGSAWRFLPFTALVSDATVTLTHYNDPLTPNAAVLVADSKRFNARLGLQGNLTRVLSLRVLAGYAMENYDDRALEDYENVIGEAVLGAAWGGSKYEAGYQRTVQPSPIGAWVQLDRGVARASFLLAQSVSLAFEFGAGKARYGRIVGARNGVNGTADAIGVDKDTGAATTQRHDTRVDGGAHAEYRVTNWLAILADFTAFASLTNFEYLQGLMAPPDPARFIVYQAFGGVRLYY